MGARRRAADIATRLGRMLKEARTRRHLSQGELAADVCAFAALVSHLERGLGATTSLETWAIVGSAVGLDLAAFFEATPGASVPRDYEHLKRQQLVISAAEGGGWQPLLEAPIDFDRLRSRSIDVLLLQLDRREAAAVEIWDWFDDVGKAIRGLDAKIAALDRHLSLSRDLASSPWHTSGLWVVRGTARNRLLVREFEALFAAKFRGSSSGWFTALVDPARRVPPRAGFIWTDSDGRKLQVARIGSS
jgi:transcriptional regulator with XRE-family HTH domain